MLQLKKFPSRRLSPGCIGVRGGVGGGGSREGALPQHRNFSGKMLGIRATNLEKKRITSTDIVLEIYRTLWFKSKFLIYLLSFLSQITIIMFDFSRKFCVTPQLDSVAIIPI